MGAEVQVDVEILVAEDLLLFAEYRVGEIWMERFFPDGLHSCVIALFGAFRAEQVDGDGFVRVRQP